jgi:hypothetical protein
MVKVFKALTRESPAKRGRVNRYAIYIPGLDNIRKTRCVLSLINPINKMHAMLASLKKNP